ncbi:hypothetical protein ACHAXT_007853 [Thalassiosira profunda]
MDSRLDSISLALASLARMASVVTESTDLLASGEAGSNDDQRIFRGSRSSQDVHKAPTALKIQPPRIT